MKKIELLGQRFGRLVVIGEAPKQKHLVAWVCKCDCGNTTVVPTQSLRRNLSRSCGCLRDETNSLRITKHKGWGTRMYYIWQSMIQRCTNPNSKAYKDYGGRGITVCEEWKNDFQSFYDWAMVYGYTDELTIDRIDNNKGYSPDNCRWTTPKEQANNTRQNHYITYNGITKTISQWAEEIQIPHTILRGRLRMGWSIERMLTTPSRRRVNEHNPL